MRKLLSRLLVLPGILSGTATSAVDADGTVRLRPGKLLRFAASYPVWFAAFTVFAYLLFSRAPTAPFLLAAGLGVSAAAYVATSLILGAPLRPRCPHCGAPVFRVARVDDAPAAFLGRCACRSCGGLLDLFRAASVWPAPLTARDYLRLSVVCGAVTAAVALAGASVVARAWDVAGTISMERARRAVTAAGFSYTAPPDAAKTPDADNAVPDYLEAGRLAGTLSTDDAATLSSFIKDGSGTASARRIVAGREKVLALAERASMKSGADWGIDWKRWPFDAAEEDASWLTGFQTLQFLTDARALLDARDGDAARAVADVRLALRLADAVRARGDLIGHMTALGGYRGALGAARLVLPRVSAAAAERAWESELRPEELNASFLRALQTEKFLLRERIIAKSYADSAGSFWILRWLSAAEIKFDIASSHRFNAALLATLALPPREFERRSADVERTLGRRLFPLAAISNAGLPLRPEQAANLDEIDEMKRTQDELRRRTRAASAGP